ncbi:MAG: methyltransferase, partial [Candidatus Omnitrophota bacterium]|nr:methyltransferase [Candidatus Omnitrophota bacterium]
IAGDYNNDDFGKGYDLVFLSAVIHKNSPEQNRALIRNSACALRGNGRIVIQDFIMGEDRTRPQWGAFFALNMLVATESGDTYTESEVRAWLKEAGFTGIVRKDTKFGTALIIGKKRNPYF